MGHYNTCRRQKLDNKVPVAYSVQAVSSNSVEAQLLSHIFPVYWEAGSGQGRTSKGTNIYPLSAVLEPIPVTPEHFKIGQHVMWPKNRLCPLEMGVAREYQVLVGPCLMQKRFL